MIGNLLICDIAERVRSRAPCVALTRPRPATSKKQN